MSCCRIRWLVCVLWRQGRNVGVMVFNLVIWKVVAEGSTEAARGRALVLGLDRLASFFLSWVIRNIDGSVWSAVNLFFLNSPRYSGLQPIWASSLFFLTLWCFRWKGRVDNDSRCFLKCGSGWFCWGKSQICACNDWNVKQRAAVLWVSQDLQRGKLVVWPWYLSGFFAANASLLLWHHYLPKCGLISALILFPPHQSADIPLSSILHCRLLCFWSIFPCFYDTDYIL